MNSRRLSAFLAFACALFALATHATMVKRMALDELVQAAGLIFRGTVVDIARGSITTSGREIPTITYEIRVSERFKGDFPAASGGDLIVSIRSVDLKVIELPRLEDGEEYLLMTTKPSSAGLSTVVGLGQGVFRVYGSPNVELAVNALDNRRLAAGLGGPARYDDLTNRIRSALRKGEQK